MKKEKIKGELFKLKRLLFCFLFVCIAGTFFSFGEVSAADSMMSFLEKLFVLNGSKQAIVVSTDYEGNYKAAVDAYERKPEGWVKSFDTMEAVVGKNGFSTNKIEGDGKAPAGIFRIGHAFGIPYGASITKLPYRKVTENDYWIDDITSVQYNNWVEYKGNPNDKWKSFERLNITPYKYSIVIEYNMNPVIAGKGSAIFLHIWKDSNSGTSGCTAVSEDNMLKLLKWLDPKSNPVIIQGTGAMIKEMMNNADETVLYPVKVKVNGKEVDFDVHPRIVDGRTLVPVRAIFEEMGAKVSWDEKEHTVTITRGSSKVVLKIGSKTAFIDNQEVELDVPASIINGRTLVPVRFIAEGLRFNVGWDGGSRTVTIDEDA
jgi:L,D-peptidoglycan transpeptidase YkuD (ErfK/YbiS/YcfS/YnhG family)